MVRKCLACKWFGIQMASEYRTKKSVKYTFTLATSFQSNINIHSVYKPMHSRYSTVKYTFTLATSFQLLYNS